MAAPSVHPDVAFVRMRWAGKAGGWERGRGRLGQASGRQVHAVFEQAVITGEEMNTTKPETAAAVVPFSVWSDIVKPVWSIRWATSGLMPVRPLITALTDIEIPPKSVYMLSE